MDVVYRKLIAPNGRMLDLPLPGFYPCLTWQLNVTLHQEQQTAKFVSVLREPTDKLEILRTGHNPSAWEAVMPEVQTNVMEMIRALDYLGGSGKGI